MHSKNQNFKFSPLEYIKLLRRGELKSLDPSQAGDAVMVPSEMPHDRLVSTIKQSHFEKLKNIVGSLSNEDSKKIMKDYKHELPKECTQDDINQNF